MDYNGVFENANRLHDINFNTKDGIIRIGNYKENREMFSIFNNRVFDLNGKNNSRTFKELVGCCHLCENNEYNTPDPDKLKIEKKTDDYNGYKLCYVSHGTHSIDYLHAAGMSDKDIMKEFKTNEWNTKPVLFLMENPSKDYDNMYKKTQDEHYIKYPINTWYWIHREQNSLEYMKMHADDYLKQGKYGEMVYALITNNKLANAYLTNIVKCGMNKRWKDDNGEFQDDYLGTYWYQTKCKKLCGETNLAKEVSALVKGKDELIVFAFGNNAYYFAKDFLQNCNNKVIRNIKNKQLVLLPHPSNRTNNQFRKVILKSYVNDVLFNSSIGSINNLPNFDDKMKNTLKQILNESGVNCRCGQRNFKYGIASVKTQKEQSIFGEKEYAKNVSLRTTNNMEYWYTFDDASFYVYDGNLKKYIDDYENDMTFLAFEKAIKKVLSL